MSGIILLCLLLSVVAGESMHGVSRERIVKEEHLLHDIPQMSEWNYENPECRFHARIQGGGTGGPDPPPLKNHKSRVS